jgi:hypothetical protein
MEEKKEYSKKAMMVFAEHAMTNLLTTHSRYSEYGEISVVDVNRIRAELDKYKAPEPKQIEKRELDANEVELISFRYEPKRVDRFVIKFPISFGFDVRMITKASRPAYTNGNWENMRIEFIYEKDIENTKSGKYRPVINETI